MSIQAMTWALYNEEADTAGLAFLLLCMGNYADASGRNVFPSIPTLAADCRVDERTVQRGLRRLLEKGLIRPGDQSKVAGLSEHQRPVVYDLAMPPPVDKRRPLPGDKLPPAPGGNGDSTPRQAAITPGGTMPPDPSKRSVREPQSARARETAARTATETDRWVYLRELAEAAGFRRPRDIELQIGPQVYESALRVHLRDTPRAQLSPAASVFMGYTFGRATA